MSLRLPSNPFPLVILGLVLAALLPWMLWILRLDRDDIHVGQVYLRVGLPDSAMVTEILNAAPTKPAISW